MDQGRPFFCSCHLCLISTDSHACLRYLVRVHDKDSDRLESDDESGQPMAMISSRAPDADADADADTHMTRLRGDETVRSHKCM